MDHTEKPPVAATFLVVFDQKVGYTTAWKRTVPDLNLDGVEYKSLPSGLHGVKQDLVYFIHEGHAGVSLFVRDEADAKHRNAKFVAVGALVPLSYGRLGRAWSHAEELRRLAKTVVKDVSDTRALELFWKQHRLDKAVPVASPSTKRMDPMSPFENRKRKRALSDATMGGLGAHTDLPPDHPALSTPELLDTFGPLLFPLYRAALLRKRVLLLGTPPVQNNANVLYVLSILSSISPSLYESLPTDAEPLFSSRPLFSVGIHDIATLDKDQDPAGWLACTTDDILGEKKKLYDLLVKMPATDRQWPELRCADGRVVKASQRDMRRWKLLRRELRRLRRRGMEREAEESAGAGGEDDDDDHTRPLLSRTNTGDVAEVETSHRDENEAAEAPSWTALAYRGFMWWASAGEAGAWENDETKADEELLFDLPDIDDVLPSSPGGVTSTEESRAHHSRAVATVVVAYFRRLTAAMLTPLAGIVEDADDDTEQGVQEEEIVLSVDDVREMGLDTWSATDKEFVRHLGKTWFQRDVSVAEGGVRVCGLRVC